MSAWLMLGIVACAVGAISGRRLVGRALWLTATSVLLAILLASMGAPVVAAVEVSVGAGLVAVLFVFTVGIAGEEGLRGHSVVPRPLALVLVAPAALLLLWLALPTAHSADAPAQVAAATRPLADVLWNERAADLLGQIVLIVVAALTVRTILGSDRAAPVSVPGRPDSRPTGAEIESAPATDSAVVPIVRAPIPPAASVSERAGAREEVRT